MHFEIGHVCNSKSMFAMQRTSVTADSVLGRLDSAVGIGPIVLRRDRPLLMPPQVRPEPEPQLLDLRKKRKYLSKIADIF